MSISNVSLVQCDNPQNLELANFLPIFFLANNWNYTVNKIDFSPSCMFLILRSTATGDFRPIFGRADFAQLPFVLLLAPFAIEGDCLAEAISSNCCL